MGKGKRNRANRAAEQALDDQLTAANLDMRHRFESAIPGAVRTDSIPKWAKDLLDSVSTPALQRCEHLQRTPAQPWFMSWWEKIWRCTECTQAQAELVQSSMQRGIYIGPGEPEEGTCDRCRGYVGGENLSPFVLRDNIWLVTFGVCEPCTVALQEDGAHIAKPAP